MAATKDRAAGTKMETKEFTWRIENFSKLTETKLYSDTFIAGGHKWRIMVYPYGSVDNSDHLAVYLDFPDWETMAQGWNVPAIIRLSLIDQLNAISSLGYDFACNFCGGDATSCWGFDSLVIRADLHDPRKGFLVNDTLLIEARVTVAGVAGAEAATDHDHDHDEPKGIDHEATKESLTDEKHLPTDQVNNADHAEPSKTSSTLSTTLITSRFLIEELSSITTSTTCKSSSSTPDGSVQLQRDKLGGYFVMPIEYIAQTESLDRVKNAALQIANQPATDPVEKAILEELVGRLDEFKATVSASLSTIEASHAVESYVAETVKGLKVRLYLRGQLLSSLVGEVSRLGIEEMKLADDHDRDGGGQNKSRVEADRDSIVARLEKGNQEASVELEELKKQYGESNEAVGRWIRAKEKLAQANASWKFFKEYLRY